MIYTVTFNPSLDYIISMRDFKPGRTNRTETERIFPGGKGINVSIVLHHLGVENTALGFAAGFTGRQIEQELETMGLHTDFIWLKEGFSRINVKWKENDGTELNGMGPKIGSYAIEQLCRKLEKLKAGDILVLAGSIPNSLPDSIYGDILKRLAGRGILFVVDATGDLLLKTLRHRPFFIKPNRHELEEIFHVTLKRPEDAVFYAKKLQELGAGNVLASMSGQGAVLADERGETHVLSAPKGRLVSAVGAGDSMVAGFLAGWLEKGNFDYAFRMGVAAGSASAFSEFLAEKEDIERVFRDLEKTHFPETVSSRSLKLPHNSYENDKT